MFSKVLCILLHFSDVIKKSNIKQTVQKVDGSILDCSNAKFFENFIEIPYLGYWHVVYHVGASFRNLENQMTAFSVLNFVTKEQVLAVVR